MTLLDYMKIHDEEELVVEDSEYDTEFYFSYDPENADRWDRAMYKIASKLTIKNKKNGYIFVDLAEVIKKSMPAIIKADIFKSNDIDDIMDDMTNILAGYVSESWLEKFANCLA